MNKLIANNLQIFVNSKNASLKNNGFNSDCIFNLEHMDLEDAKLIYVSVQTAQIPYSFFNCDDYDNTLIIFTPYNATTYTITIPEGNYNVNTLATTLINSVLTATGLTMTITFNSLTNKYTFTTTQNFVFKKESTCFELLGFAENADYSSVALSLDSNQSVNFFTIKTILIEVSNLITDNMTTGNDNNAGILASIPITSSQGSIISYSNIFGIKNRVNSIKNFTSLHIRLLDDDSIPSVKLKEEFLL
jgi:hypothetical protein